MKARALLALLLALAATPMAAGTVEEVRGVATFTERIALPENAVFEATVQDISRADAAAAVVGRTRIENPGSPPIAFTVPVPSERIDPRARYSLRAVITVDGRLILTTDRVHPVLTQGTGRHAEVQLRPVPVAPRGAATVAPFASLPATFAGDLPCADCPALRVRLNLFADQSFFFSQFYEGRSAAPSYDIGRWTLSADGALVLAGGREAPVRLRRVDADTLRLLAPDGREPPPPARPSLLRRVAFEPMAPQLFMRGTAQVTPEGTVFVECLTQQRWRVAPGGDAAALDAGVAQARAKADAPVLASLEGTVEPAAGGLSATLRVQRFVRVWPGETCGPAGGPR